jgi:hypothetical protein
VNRHTSVSRASRRIFPSSRTRSGRDAAWHIAHPLSKGPPFDNYGLSLPLGDYVVRLVVPGLEPMERAATITASEVARAEFDIP